MTTQLTRADRPAWPKRAVVTAGMPYGNKGLHFGHVGGVFVPADFYARFLRDRLGRENVIFVSGTDCYGSPIMEASANAKRPTTTRSTSQTTCARTMTARKPTLPALACLATCTPAARWSPPCTSTSA